MTGRPQFESVTVDILRFVELLWRPGSDVREVRIPKSPPDVVYTPIDVTSFAFPSITNTATPPPATSIARNH